VTFVVVLAVAAVAVLAPGAEAALKPLPIKVAGDQSDGTTLALSVGQRLHVVLSSTYWTIAPSSNGVVLRERGQPTLSPNSNCVPGGGCGTAEATYVALATGHADVTATRTTCGEAMSCGTTPETYTLHVVVHRRR
jgi:hypothetical protein